MRTITSKADAYTTEHGPSPDELMTMTDASSLFFFPYGAKYVPTSWSKVGEATITVEIDDVDTLIDRKVDALKDELKAHRADAQVKENALQDKISKLLAIGCEVAS